MDFYYICQIPLRADSMAIKYKIFVELQNSTDISKKLCYTTLGDTNDNRERIQGNGIYNKRTK